tara:strand:+ start:50987 stop:51886 length:900 start_codon:yes stop_codon:yes gene_type:complete
MPRKKDYSFTEIEDTSNIQEEAFLPSDFDNIDSALYEYVKNKNIFATTNKGWKQVPVVWVSAERAYQLKHNKDLRNKEGVFTLPVIAIERTNIAKDLQRKGAVFGNAYTNERGGTITIARRINQDKTQNFANADSYRINKQSNFPTFARTPGNVTKTNKIVYQTATIPLPTYIDITYSIVLRAEYQQQINEMVEPFITTGKNINYFTMSRNNHTYEGFVQQDFSAENNASNLQEEERKYETKVDIKVLGYLIGEGKNQETPKIVWKENFVDVKIGRERTVFQDEQEWEHNIQEDHEYRD